MFDFPASPTEGQIFTPPGGPTYVWQSPVWVQTPSVVFMSRMVQTMITTPGAGVYTKPEGLKALEVTIVGGGGGSSAANATTAGQGSVGGSGGGGATVIKLYAAADIDATEAYTVGDRGGSPSGVGSLGGTSTFKGLTATGGGGGGAASTAGATMSPVQGGGGGTASGGDINIHGGQGGTSCANHSGVAGRNELGMAGESHLTNRFGGIYSSVSGAVVGVPGRTPGGGAIGASNSAAQSVTSGAVGGYGCIIFKEYF